MGVGLIAAGLVYEGLRATGELRAYPVAFSVIGHGLRSLAGDTYNNAAVRFHRGIPC